MTDRHTITAARPRSFEAIRADLVRLDREERASAELHSLARFVSFAVPFIAAAAAIGAALAGIVARLSAALPL